MDPPRLVLILSENWTLLDPRWNVQLEWLPTFGRDRYPPEERRRLRAEMVARPKLLHYVGPRKPWHWLNKGSKNEEFYRAFRNSGWLTSVCHHPAGDSAPAGAAQVPLARE